MVPALAVKGFMTITLSAVVVPHRPVEVAVIVAAPLNAASQFITPVAGFITPAVPGKTEYAMEELLAAVAVYVSSASSWQTVVAPAVKTVVPVDGFTVTTLSAFEAPHRPVEEAVIVAAPLNTASQFSTPVAGFITPAVPGKTEYAMEELLAAVAVYVSSAASWQIVMAPAVKTIAPVDGFTVTTMSADVVPHRPVDVAVIVAALLNAASQFITPVAEFKIPAVTGNTEYEIEVLFAAEAV
jgi:hypothetical protein